MRLLMPSMRRGRSLRGGGALPLLLAAAARCSAAAEKPETTVRDRLHRQRRRPRAPARSTSAAISARIIAPSCASRTAPSLCAATSAATRTIRTIVVWQASVGKTARECLWDLQGGSDAQDRRSGRVIAGPKGGAATVSVPLRIAVVKHKEAVLASEGFQLDVAIPAAGSTAFTEVQEILVPSPGRTATTSSMSASSGDGGRASQPAGARSRPSQSSRSLSSSRKKRRRRPPSRLRPAQPKVLPTPTTVSCFRNSPVHAG